ncbi:MAG: YhcH/YjgK/YiaL family protein [Anaeroplasmataceae bacterium]|nr:YhcH/YjgK/YiaL family protein [Anaeroplasmataceae bacterium]MDE5868474.1 YhcH/YjgK/YiaL family protein [Anaeroplasmataceae bacterium]
MIVAKLRDIKRYKGISKNIDTAIDYILTHDLMALPKGKTIIDGDKVYVNRDTYVARPLEECFFENHEHYLDLQIVLKGQEIFGYTDITNPTLQVTTPYNTEKDVTKYSATKDTVYFTLDESFALVFKEDIHLAKCKANDGIVEKAVVKIRIEE